MSGRPQVIAHMTPFPHAIELHAPITEARAFMSEHHTRHLPVIDAGKLAGIVADRDITLVLGTSFDDPAKQALCVRDVCRKDIYVVDASTPLDEVLATMAERHIGSAVVTRHGKLAGIMTSVDVCRAYAEDLKRRFAVDVDDSVAQRAHAPNCVAQRSRHATCTLQVGSRRAGRTRWPLCDEDPVIAFLELRLQPAVDLLGVALTGCRSTRTVAAEELILRRQLALYEERGHPPGRIDTATRISLALRPRQRDWRAWVTVVRPETLIRWHRLAWRHELRPAARDSRRT